MDVAFWQNFFLYGFLGHLFILVYWFFMITFTKDFILNWHAKVFKVPVAKLIVIHYCAMVGFKLIGISFFLLPYICLKILA